MRELNPLVKFYPSNTTGRDFVVGDLHGCYSALQALLEHVKFHPARDRLFSVGDLVDRGPHSHLVLELLKKPWFFSCMGNHEQSLLAHLQSPKQFMPYDPVWIKKLCPSGVEWQMFAGKWKNTLKNLPIIMAVGDKSDPHRFFVVHAELLESRQSVTEDHVRLEMFSDPAKTKKRAIWGRALIGAFYNQKPVKRAHDSKMPLIFCGHTILERPTLLARQVYLDGGAYLAFDVLKEKDFTPKLRLFDVTNKKCYACDPTNVNITYEKVYAPPTL